MPVLDVRIKEKLEEILGKRTEKYFWVKSFLEKKYNQNFVSRSSWKYSEKIFLVQKAHEKNLRSD